MMVLVFSGETNAPKHLQRSLADSPSIAPSQGLHYFIEPWCERSVGLNDLLGYCREGSAVHARPGEQVTNGLESSDWLPELLSITRMFNRQTDNTFARTEHVKGEGNAAEVLTSIAKR